MKHLEVLMVQSHVHQKILGIQARSKRKAQSGFCVRHSCRFDPVQGCYFCCVGAKAVVGKNVWRKFKVMKNEESEKKK